MATIWLDHRHPTFHTRLAQDLYTWDHYTGGALDKVLSARRGIDDTTHFRRDADGRLIALDHGAASLPYLVRRAQGEHIQEFKERAGVSRFPRHFAYLISSFCGALSNAEDEADRTWGEGEQALGDPADEGTVMHGYWHDADGQGLNWPLQNQQVTQRLATQHRIWYMVDPPSGDARARRMLLDPATVLNWYEGRDGLEWVLLSEARDDRADPWALSDDDDETEHYLLLTRTGYWRYTVNRSTGSQGEPEVAFEREQSGRWLFPFYREPDAYERDPWAGDYPERPVAPLPDDALFDPLVHRLPLAYTELALDEPVGYRAAQGQNYLYNFLSDVRMGLRKANHAKLAPQGEPLDEAAYEHAAAMLLAGAGFLTFPAEYVAPPIANASGAYEIYRQEVRDYMVTMHHAYEDRAREATATERKQDQQRGFSAFLGLLARAMDEFENDSLFLLEQIEFPEMPEAWGQAKVERAKQFEPVDVLGRAEALLPQLFPMGLDLPAAVEGKVKRKLLSDLGMPIDEEDEAAFEAQSEETDLLAAQEAAARRDLALADIPNTQP